jgi:hypothetical protein
MGVAKLMTGFSDRRRAIEQARRRPVHGEKPRLEPRRARVFAFLTAGRKNQTRRGGYRDGFDDQSIQAGVSSPKRRRLPGLGDPSCLSRQEENGNFSLLSTALAAKGGKIASQLNTTG